ncbi:putative metallo-hydrolase YqgX [Kurthia zopfii]|uniref:Glyoxylase-like metal-dependent hydrolase (Beta-lactamase superfamily II) n=1 Tax=Kurthia zopfii TaxID=1650 RepID=A0A8B4QBC2_9BACL|nr:glyoxylase-like metal-dependent hydrolase (beta-lactamase superfamily II) [Kurthia zopfii]GEK31657.1 putative metallo-hydrolase YqgX [Kurthia zopfii]STX10006.1 hydroxyacylglutathione hydrolase [Kurthia zopfii]
MDIDLLDVHIYPDLKTKSSIIGKEVNKLLNIRRIPLGPIQTNCYIVSNKEKECLIIDPGEQGHDLIKQIKNANLKPIAILLTHAHFDHIGAVDDVRKEFAVDMYMHKKESAWLSDPQLNGSGKYAQLPDYVVAPAEHFLAPGEAQVIGNFTFDVLHTPGHSPGSISFLFDNKQIAIVGDTLFKRSIGRTDLAGGNSQLLLESIHKQLLSLDEETMVYPGHDEPTTIGAEIDGNPFLNGF